MSNLSIRKKSLNTWLHTDSVFGDFIISKFYFNSFEAKFQIVEEGNTRLEQYLIANITLYDDTDGGVAETFSTITELSLRLEELQYPAFDRSGGVVSISGLIEAGTNVTITGSGTTSDPYVINSSGGGGTTPTLQQVTEENPSLTKTIEFAGDPSKTFASSLTEIIIGAGDNHNIDEEATVKAYSSFSNGEDTLSASVQVQNEVTAGYLRMELDTATNKAIAVLSATNESQGFRASADHSNFLEDFSYPQKIYVDAIIVNANITAINNRKYTVIANATFTDPTPSEGKGYTVFVRNGTATIGGVGYTAGSLVYRVYHSGAWSSTSKQDTLTDVNFGNFMDVGMSTKLTPSPNDFLLARDHLTNEAVEIPFSTVFKHYSTTEKLTGGTWIDNKPIYRKVIEYTLDSSGFGFSVAHGISDFENLVEGKIIVPILGKIDTISASLNWGDCYVTSTDVEVENTGALTDLDINIILEYTKTTD